MRPIEIIPQLILATVLFIANPAGAANLERYYAHPAVLDKHGVIAPWYGGLNGQCDLRVRIAAETLKRYPWTTTNNAIVVYPDYLFTSKWQISSNGTITPENPGDWMNGDLGQRSTSVLNGWVDYYRYTGDPAAIAHMSYMADYLLDHALTPADHPWPLFPISVPTKGVPYGNADPSGMIQLDICGDMGRGLLRAYQVTGKHRWLEAAMHWGDLFAANCNHAPEAAPWNRYANPESCRWKINEQTGGVTMILSFLDELIRLGYTGHDNAIVKARDAGRRYLLEQLLPRWTEDKTWGLYFWDWPNPTQNCSTTSDVVSYLIRNAKEFLNWKVDARNILSIFLNRSSADPASRGDVYSGAWAYPESSRCCDRSLWYAPIMVGAVWCQYGVEADDEWARELGYRQLLLQTYDVHENGVSEDNIDGGIIVNGKWLNIAHPWPLRWVLTAIGWLPEELGASRENHIVRASAVVKSVTYAKGKVAYTTFDAPTETTVVLRLSFVPNRVLADGKPLRRRAALNENGYTVKKLPNGDAIIHVRHDGATNVMLEGKDPQVEIAAEKLKYQGPWEQAEPRGRRAVTGGTSATATFRGTQVRVIGPVGPAGGLADVYLDEEKQLVQIDSWNPEPRVDQVLYSRNGLAPGRHTVRVAPTGAGNPYSKGTDVTISRIQYSAETKPHHFPQGTGPVGTQRMIFGYTKRQDYAGADGHLWKPAGEIVSVLGKQVDALAVGWWTNASDKLPSMPDQELYRYGYHGTDFTVILTVGPGRYDVRLCFANTRDLDTTWNAFDVLVNGRKLVDRLDVNATAGGPNKPVDLVFRQIAPSNGVVRIRFRGLHSVVGNTTRLGEAFVQALEIGPTVTARGARPVSSRLEPSSNLLLDASFEETAAGVKSGPGRVHFRGQWVYVFAGRTNDYVFQESEYGKHPGWGAPEFRSGAGALRTHSDGGGHTTVYQDVEAKPNTTYAASVWVKPADLRGKGFGTHPDDSAALVLEELDHGNKVLVRHPPVETKAAGPYQLLKSDITTSARCARLRLSLNTRIDCRFTEGHVTYDDCILREVGG